MTSHQATPVKEPKVLAVFERIGQLLCTVLLPINKNDEGPLTKPLWGIRLIAFLSRARYLFTWMHYFVGGKREWDFHRLLFSIPLPLAVGHIGITAREGKAIRKTGKEAS